MIPKIIHQIWLGSKSIPGREKVWSCSWQRDYPDWEYRFWGEKQIAELEPKLLAADWILSPRMNPAMRSDLLRYELLRIFGGMYVDLDYQSLFNFSHLFEGDCFHYGDEKRGRPCNAWLASPPDHPILQTMTQHLALRMSDLEMPSQPTRRDLREFICQATGPRMMHRLMSWWLNHNHRPRAIMNDEVQVGARYSGNLVCFYPNFIYPRTTAASTQAAAVHHFVSAWLPHRHKQKHVITNPRRAIKSHIQQSHLRPITEVVPQTFDRDSKVLLIGSAPYMPEWWKEHGQKFRDAGYVIAALNNAWAIPDELPDMWFVPHDYFFTSPEAARPSLEKQKQMQWISNLEYDHFCLTPLSYEKVDGGTMMLNGIAYLTNRLAEVGGGVLAIAGCDLQYPAGATHFYPNGKADPLRAGIEWIEKVLARWSQETIPGFFNKTPVRLYNVGTSPTSVLPFTRALGVDGLQALEGQLTLPVAEERPAFDYAKAKADLGGAAVALCQKSGEMRKFCEIVHEKKPQVLVEVGSREGGSLWMLANACPPGSTIISVDLPNSLWGSSNSNVKREAVASMLKQRGYDIHLVTGNSQDSMVIQKTEGFLKGREIDVLFLDGDHRWSGISADWENYGPMVRVGGLVAFHDIQESQRTEHHKKIKVFLLWRALKSLFKSWEFIEERGVMGIGIVELDKKVPSKI